MMASSAAQGWRLAGPSEDDVDAVEAALNSETATLTYGHHSFEFAKLPAADGGLLLRLSHRADSRCMDGERGCVFTWLNGLTCEQPVPCVKNARDPETCATVNVKLLHAVGRAFFFDVARLIEAAERRDGSASNPVRDARGKATAPAHGR
jgi:hypothetical protein